MKRKWNKNNQLIFFVSTFLISIIGCLFIYFLGVDLQTTHNQKNDLKIPTKKVEKQDQGMKAKIQASTNQRMNQNHNGTMSSKQKQKTSSASKKYEQGEMPVSSSLDQHSNSSTNASPSVKGATTDFNEPTAPISPNVPTVPTIGSENN